MILAWKDTVKKIKEIIEKAPVCYCVDYDIPVGEKVTEALLTISGKTFVARASISGIEEYNKGNECLKKRKDGLKTCIKIESIEEIQDDVVNYEEVTGGSVEKIESYAFIVHKEEAKIELKDNP